MQESTVYLFLSSFGYGKRRKKGEIFYATFACGR